MSTQFDTLTHPDMSGKHIEVTEPPIQPIENFEKPTCITFKRPIGKFNRPIHSQVQSPLLQLPAELRLLILRYLIDPPKILYNWLDMRELAKQSVQNRDALLEKALQVKIFCCCQKLLEESRAVLYGSTILRIQCQWFGDWSRVAICGGRLVLDRAPYIQKEVQKGDIPRRDLQPQNARSSTGTPSFTSTLLFRRIEVSMIDDFLHPAFHDICDTLKYIIAGKDVAIIIRRNFPGAALNGFEAWKCKSIVVSDAKTYPELKSIRDLIGTRRDYKG